MYTLRIIHDEKGKNGKFSSRRENINLGDNYTVYPRGSDECEKPNGNKVRIIRRLIGGCRPFHYFLQEINQDGKKLKIRNVPEKELLSGKLEVYPGRTVLIVPGV